MRVSTDLRRSCDASMKVDMPVDRSSGGRKSASRPDGHSPTAAVVARIEGEVRATAGELIGKVQDARLKAHAATLRIEGDMRRKAGGLRRSVDRFQDEAKFIKNWVDSPIKLGAVAPSSPFLARAMAERIDPTAQGPVIEIGPGTGPVTEALIARGVAEDGWCWSSSTPISAPCCGNASRKRRSSRAMPTRSTRRLTVSCPSLLRRWCPRCR